MSGLNSHIEHGFQQERSVEKIRERRDQMERWLTVDVYRAAHHYLHAALAAAVSSHPTQLVDVINHMAALAAVNPFAHYRYLLLWYEQVRKGSKIPTETSEQLQRSLQDIKAWASNITGRPLTVF